ncbi:MAG: porin family protein [Nitrospiria bacterium]
MKRSFLYVVIIVVSLVASVDRSFAKQGLYLGAEILYNNISGDFDGTNGPDSDDGGGVGLILGYGFTPNFSAQLNLDVSFHDASVVTGSPVSDSTLNAFLLVVKYNFLSGQQLRPYVNGGLGVFSFNIDDPFLDVELSGDGLQLGLGVDYIISPNISFGFGIERWFIDYDEMDVGGLTLALTPEVGGDTTSVKINSVFYF